MNRHPALHPLSHQHRNALSVALSLRRAGTPQARLSAEAAAGRFARFWADEGEEHLRLEEEVLLPHAAPYIELDEPRLAWLLRDHVELRALAQELATRRRPDLDLLHRLGERWEEHVRFEERQVFPMLEERVPEEILARINRQLPQDTGLDGCGTRPPKA